MAAIQLFEVTIGGDRLMMHNPRLSDPLSPYTKALKEYTARKKKSDEDHAEIARREFIGGIYCDDKAGPYVPDLWLNAMLVEGARKRKQGKQAEANLSVVDEVNPLIYEGPRTVDGLLAAGTKFVDRRSVGNQQARVMRTRPIFRNWKVKFVVQLLESDLNMEDVELAIENAAPYGIGDGRPMHAGKFAVIEFKPVKTRKA